LLEGLPDPAHADVAVSELTDWDHSRQAVPDRDQARRRPVAGELREILEAIESFGSLCCVAIFTELVKLYGSVRSWAEREEPSASPGPRPAQFG